MKKIKFFQKDGFTLMGVIFAIGIAVVGLMGILSLLRYVVVSSRYSHDKFVATNLAMEGIELVRAMRDSNWTATPRRDWNFGFPAGSAAQAFDYRSNNSLPAYDADSASLKIDSNGYYNYETGQLTKFKRKIYFHNASPGCSGYAGDCYSIVSQVTWGNYSIILEDRLYDWML